MTVYVLHRLSLKDAKTAPMEGFPSLERASVAFQTRALRQASKTFVLEGGRGVPSDGEVPFPEADLTGYMVVWRRSDKQGPPRSGDTPDELWRMKPTGGVVRQRWSEKEHGVPLRKKPLDTAVCQLASQNAELRKAEEEFVAEPHPGFGAVALAYWVDGRMKLTDMGSGVCGCGRDGAHEREVRVLGRLMDGELFNLPPGTDVWHVRSGAPDADGARKVAHTVAKGLGFSMNPVFSEGEGS